MLSLKASKANFFDRTAVTSAVDRARQKVLGRQGAYVRKVMRRLVGKKRKGPSTPPNPPHAHVGLIKDKVFFAYDQGKNDVVVGPVQLGNSTACETLDKGGTVKVRGIRNRRGEFVPLRLLKAESRRAAIAKGAVVIENRPVAARPFSQPALDNSAPYLAKEWKGAVKK